MNNKPAFFCKFCGRLCGNPGANKSHEDRCKNNPNPVLYYRSPNAGRKNGCSGWNKGLTKFTNPNLAHSTATKEKISKEARKRVHSKETKDKISAARIQYLAINPDKVPYKLNHYSKGRSYPEKYWKEVFDSFGLKYEEQYKIHTYQLDFALVSVKINIEIDGDQHYLDERIVKSDARRTEYLESLGWRVMRIRWSAYQKIKNQSDRERFVMHFIDEIRTGS